MQIVRLACSVKLGISSLERYEMRTDANGSDGEGSYIGVNLGPPAVGCQKEYLVE